MTEYAVGLMSGTSLDGIDAALVAIERLEGNPQYRLVKFLTDPFPDGVSPKIRQAMDPTTSDVVLITSLNYELGHHFGNAVLHVCQKAGIDTMHLTFVASHGQTLYHLPNPKRTDQYASTLQIGEPDVICEMTQTDVVSNFRARDIAAGGQGAPIVPYSEYLLYRNKTRTQLLLNIGGIANVTIIPQNASLDQLIAFDTGPGNMVINALCEHFYDKPYDANGMHAKNGRVHTNLLKTLRQHPYFGQQPPKTTGREDFGAAYVQNILSQEKLPADDWIATASELTIQTIAEAVIPYATENATLIIGGGGAYNPVIVAGLERSLPDVRVVTQEALGYRADAKEALAMVVLGDATLHHEASNVPSATGAHRPVILGDVTYYS